MEYEANQQVSVIQLVQSTTSAAVHLISLSPLYFQSEEIGDGQREREDDGQMTMFATYEQLSGFLVRYFGRFKQKWLADADVPLLQGLLKRSSLEKAGS